MIWKNLSLGKKITVTFGIVLLILAVSCILSYTGIQNIVKNAHEVIEGNQFDAVLAQKEVDHLNWATALNSLLTDDSVTEVDLETDEHKCGFGRWLYGQERKIAEEHIPSLTPLIKSIEAPHRALHQSAIEITKDFQHADWELGNFLREKKADHLTWALKVKDVLVDSSLKHIEAEMDPTQCSLGKWLYSESGFRMKSRDPRFGELLTQLEEPHNRLHMSARQLEDLISREDHEGAHRFYMDTIEPLAFETLNVINQLVSWQDDRLKVMQAANKIYASQTMPALKQVQSLLHDIREETKANILADQAMLKAAHKTRLNLIVTGISSLIIGVILSFLMTRSLSGILQRISHQIRDVAVQVASASAHISSASQSLAQSTSQQAASLEETSSSLEELASMTQQNAQHANEADLLMAEAETLVKSANISMEDLIGSMNEISSASEQTSKIIKTIDEIAFQTNLLALNAAVEAARAGEAGAGFAVVAGEVRRLALRSTEAARNTDGLIKDTLTKVERGESLVTKTNEAFSKVFSSVQRVKELVDEIAVASREQSQGLSQLNKAVAEMDTLTQHNASNAEESASASEQMNSQADQMKQFVAELLLLVKGGEASRSRNEISFDAGPEEDGRLPAAASPSKKRIPYSPGFRG